MASSSAYTKTSLKSVRIVGTGDSHIAGRVGATATEQLVSCQFDNSDPAGDPNTIGSATSAGSFLSWLPEALRLARPGQISDARVINLGDGGASVYSLNGVLAHGYFNFSGVPADGETVSVGGKTYRFETTPSQAYDVQKGTQGITAQNLGYAINGEGPVLYAGTLTNPSVFVPNPTTGATYNPEMFAINTGTAGNSIAISSTSGVVTALNASVSPGATLSGGAATSPLQTNNFVNLVPGGFGTVDLVVISLGTNDATRRGYRARGFATEAAGFLAYLHATYPSAKVVWGYPPPQSDAVTESYNTGTVIPSLVALQSANPTLLSLVDTHTVQPGYPLTLTRSSDGVHCTPFGYWRWSSLYAEVCATALGY